MRAEFLKVLSPTFISVLTKEEVRQMLFYEEILVFIMLGIFIAGLISMVFASFWVPYKNSKGEYITKK